MTDQDEPDDTTPDEPAPHESGDQQPQPEATPVPHAFPGAASTGTYSYDTIGGPHPQAGASPQFSPAYPLGQAFTYTYDFHGSHLDPPAPLP